MSYFQEKNNLGAAKIVIGQFGVDFIQVFG